MHVARRVLRGLWINHAPFWQGTERPLIASVLNLLCRNASFSINTADGKGQMAAQCPVGMELPFHPSLVGMQMWELQNYGTLWTSLHYSTWILQKGLIFGGGAAELWCWGPSIIPVPPTSLFVAKVNKTHDGSRKIYFIRDGWTGFVYSGGCSWTL